MSDVNTYIRIDFPFVLLSKLQITPIFCIFVNYVYMCTLLCDTFVNLFPSKVIIVLNTCHNCNFEQFRLIQLYQHRLSTLVPKMYFLEIFIFKVTYNLFLDFEF